MAAGGAGKPHPSTRTRFLLAKSQRPTKGLGLLVVPSIYSSASPWVGSQPCGAKYPGFCADSKGV